MSALPSPLKSPTLTSTQVTSTQLAPVLQVSQRELVKLDPVDKAIHHAPPCKYRPTMSALPSPLKSPTWTSTQVAPVLQVVHTDMVKPPPTNSFPGAVPVDKPTHHLPVLASRAAMSVSPS